jgi:hypothetical protein
MSTQGPTSSFTLPQLGPTHLKCTATSKKTRLIHPCRLRPHARARGFVYVFGGRNQYKTFLKWARTVFVEDEYVHFRKT